MIIRLKNKISLRSALVSLGPPWGFKAGLMERDAPLAWYSVQEGGYHYDEQICGGER